MARYDYFAQRFCLMTENTPYPRTTRKRGLRYLMTTKHHGGGSSSDACWAKDITPDEEFQVFDDGVFREVVDESGSVFGVLRHGDGLRDLGTWLQQIATFLYTEPPTPWHGYPVYPCNSSAPENRRGERTRPSKAVFDRLETAGLITSGELKRLRKGKHN